MKFSPRTATDKPAIEKINVNGLILGSEEDEGLVPQYKGADGKWLDFHYVGRRGHKAVVRFKSYDGLERFFAEVSANWAAR